VAEVERLTADITRIRLWLGAEMTFTAGQFVNVEVPGSGELRTYSMANGPDEPRVVELICKTYPDGLFSGYLARAAVGDAVRLHGPFGQLKIHLSHRPILMIAGGSGLAPLMSMLRSLAVRGGDRAVTMFFGARSEADLYLVRQITELGRRLGEFEFVPVLSHDWGPSWSGETGMVTDAVARWRQHLAHDAYLCGPPPMIDAAVPLLIERGVRPRNIYFDAFTSAATPVPI
jgi:propane monooxygenase reductase subunit